MEPKPVTWAYVAADSKVFDLYYHPNIVLNSRESNVHPFTLFVLERNPQADNFQSLKLSARRELLPNKGTAVNTTPAKVNNT